MPDFKYRAILRDGKVIRGKVLAANKHQVIAKLKDAKIQPIVIKRMKTTKVETSRFIKKAKKPKYSPQHFKPSVSIKKISLKDLKDVQIHPFSNIKTKDVIAFVNNLYILKKANFNNIQALHALYDGTENPKFKDIIEDLLVGVEAGERLHAVMSNYPKVFPPMFVNFVRVGEESGTLDTALLYARDYVESSTKLRKEIRKAIIPRLLQFIGINGAMFVSLLIGVPMLESVYAMFGSKQSLPAATMAALGMAKWILANWYIVVAFIIAAIAIFITYINTPKGRYNWDRLLMIFPVAGKLNTNITVSKFFQAMLLNLKNGMRIQESLEVSKEVTRNYYFLSLVEVAKANSLVGESWIAPFEESKIFKPMVSSMLGIGMKTNLAEMMEKVNQYIIMEIDESIAKFTKWLPDITYIFVGIALVAFMITVMVPLINVYMGGFITM